ncbi:hypothetical protein NECAME_00268 [Necator americanus]|uniref:FZ domain-containing protein n=1 Tax=Necator americanus TaxID=51031 RepID=W2TLL6_NECAM|nr:hypothetical protein NECAME_00268 [Necator americanus]ETN81917.1 hypothetical protein NECAME_00268 [Necator americanus]
MIYEKFWELQTNTEHFKPLIKTKCNRNIQFFVCSVFAPMCPEGMPQAVTSCRSVCEQGNRGRPPIGQVLDFNSSEPRGLAAVRRKLSQFEILEQKFLITRHFG